MVNMPKDSEIPVLRRKTTNRSSVEVKSLVLEFEKLKDLKMGAEQSSTPKSPRTPNIVKQRINQFDQKPEISSERKRHKSITEENNKSVGDTFSKDFQRSKSVDFRKEKDRYQRGRQIGPRTTDEFKFDIPRRRPLKEKDATLNNNSNNNTQARKSTKKAVKVDETKVENGRDEKLAVRPAPPPPSRTPTTLTLPKASNDVQNKQNKTPKPKRPLQITKIRSVNSIKRIFESPKQNGSSASIKKLHRNERLSDPDKTSIAQSNGSDENKPDQGKFAETSDKNLSPSNNIDLNGSDTIESFSASTTLSLPNIEQFTPTPVEDSLSGNIDKYPPLTVGNTILEIEEYLPPPAEYNLNETESLVRPTDKSENREQLTKKKDKDVEEIRKSIWSEITDFYVENGNDEGHDSYGEEEYDEINITFKEMENDIEQMKKRISNGHLFENLPDETNAKGKDENKLEKVEEHETSADAEEDGPIETIDVYLLKRASSETLDEDEFGKRSFNSNENISYLEAFNRSDGLIESSVACIERRTLSEHMRSNDSLLEAIQKEQKQQRENDAGQMSSESRDSLLQSASEDELTPKKEKIQSEDISSLEFSLSDNEEEEITLTKTSSEENLDERPVRSTSADIFSDLTEVPLDTLPSKTAEGESLEFVSREGPNLEDSDRDDSAMDNPAYFTVESVNETEESGPSNRSTLYSSTCTNSSESLNLKDEEDEEKKDSDAFPEVKFLEDGNGSKRPTSESNDEDPLYEEIQIREHSHNGMERTKTIMYDSFKNPRIEKVSSILHIANSDAITSVLRSQEALSPTGAKSRIEFIVEELRDTEKKYIRHLQKVVYDYMPLLTSSKLPGSLVGKGYFLFGNITLIYTETKKFYKALKVCDNDHEKVAKTFLNFVNLWALYPLYSKNKPSADQYLLEDFKELVAKKEKELNDRLGLASYLLTPIQRLGKYILFLEQIQKELTKKGYPSENIYKAIQTVRKQMSRGNDYIAIDSIKESPVNLMEQGSFLMRGTFNVIKPRKYEAVLFLFEEILVFTTVEPKNTEMFTYKDSIKLNEMGIVTNDEQPLIFHIKRFPSYKSGSSKENNLFVMEAKKEKDKKTWTEEIEKRLWTQLVKCREEQQKLHTNQGKRTSTVQLPGSGRRKKGAYNTMPCDNRKTVRKSLFYYKVENEA